MKLLVDVDVAEETTQAEVAQIICEVLEDLGSSRCAIYEYPYAEGAVALAYHADPDDEEEDDEDEDEE